MSNETKRETKELVIAGHTVVALTYITGREQREVQVKLLDKMEVNGTNLSGLKGSMMLDQRDEYVSVVIKSIDGKTENVLEEILNLPAKEGDAIIKYVSDLVEGKDPATN